MRPVIVATFGSGTRVLIRMGAEGGAVEVYRLQGNGGSSGGWEGDGPRLDGQTQVGFDALTNVVTLSRPWGVERGVKMNPRDSRRLLKSRSPPWVEKEEAWDEGDEANFRDTGAADLRAQRAEERELKGE